MKYKVYQITEEKDPKRNAIRDAICGMNIREHWGNGLYEHVATVNARDKEHVYAIMNLWGEENEKRVERLKPLHSLSVGDILIDESNRVWECASFGYEELK